MILYGQFWWFAHNVVAHPLIVFAPRVGWWMHEYTLRKLDEVDPNAEVFSELKGGKQ